MGSVFTTDLAVGLAARFSLTVTIITSTRARLMHGALVPSRVVVMKFMVTVDRLAVMMVPAFYCCTVSTVSGEATLAVTVNGRACILVLSGEQFRMSRRHRATKKTKLKRVKNVAAMVLSVVANWRP